MTIAGGGTGAAFRAATRAECEKAAMTHRATRSRTPIVVARLGGRG
jgi:hypothetical protein